MKYRVRFDAFFPTKKDADDFMLVCKTSLTKTVNVGEEVSHCDVHNCRHDEGLPCDAPYDTGSVLGL